MARRLVREEFISKSIEVHGEKYDYSKVEYINNQTKVCIICREHGEFWQRPDKHLIGQGCPLCSKTKQSSTDEFIGKSIEVHGEKYDYSKVVYVNNKTLVDILCKEHGLFKQTPHNHLKGQGCPLCGLKKQSVPIPYESFVVRAKEVHGEKYSYPPKEEYHGISIKIPINCPSHGVFYQRPYSHLFGNGCPKCAQIENGLKKRLGKEGFISKAKEIHGNKYDYSQVDYITAKDKVKIICPKHGEFWQSPYHHLTGCCCPQCNHYTSKSEEKIYRFICDRIGQENVIKGDRSVLNGKEIDIYIPSLRIGIEFNGLYWHNETIVDRNYHLSKLEGCKEKGVKLLQIFEDEFMDREEVVYNKIEHILGLQKHLPRIMGRKCIVEEIDRGVAKAFLDEFHIQGFVSSSIYLGCLYEDKLVGVMSFKREYKDSTLWELTRFASDYHYICQGLGGKLFSYFKKHYEFSEIKSFADRRWTIDEESNIYKQLGFQFDKYTNVEYRYYNPSAEGCKRIHKFNCRKQKLSRKYGLPLTMKEREMTNVLGFKRIYDCGLIKYIYYK